MSHTKSLSNSSWFIALALVAVLSLGIDSCTKDKTPPPASVDCATVDAAANTYNLRIATYLNNNCAFSGCHSTGSAVSGVVLDNYTSAKEAFQSKDALCTIKHSSGCAPMPPGGKLADSLITYIQCWAENGYQQ